LPDVHAIETRSDAEVGAVVHDERHARSQPRSKFAGFVEHAPSVARFVAVLQQGTPSRGEFFSGGEHSGGIRKTAWIEDGV
jgi:hypothetical protein